MNILIAEDNTDIQALTGSYLDMWGFEYDMASDGQEAVKLAKANEGKYDICLMDIDMPKMNGLAEIKGLTSLIFIVITFSITSM